jgi:ABC-type multidrug transport system fused ATPase/permease subunit
VAYTRRRFNLRIWGLALGYFVFYAPYSALVKLTTTGTLASTGGAVTGFEILPPVVVGTVVVLLLGTTLRGWWKYARRRECFGVSVVWPGRLVLLSGFGTAIIIATTTLALALTGVSILFTILLMRGGVLVLAPTVDALFGRRVRWFSWCALALSFAAILLALADVNNYRMTLVAGATIAAYLFGYLLRLPCLNKLGKCEDRTVCYQYLVEELIVASVLLVAIPAIFALIGQGQSMSELRHGFTHFFESGSTAPGLLIGALYGCLYFFGTLIYLDARENSFCIPLNRASSLLAVVFATYVLADLFNLPSPSLAQLGSSILIIAALMFLSPLHHGHRVANRVRHALGVAYRAFVADFGEQTAVTAPLAQTASPESISGSNERLTDKDHFASK